MGEQTKQEVTAVSEAAARQAVSKEFHRRSSDTPREHAIRFGITLVYGGVILAAGLVLRITHLIGEPTLVVFVLAAGIVIKGESLLGFVKAWKGQHGDDAR